MLKLTSVGRLGETMATFEKPKTSREAPLDLLPVIKESGVLSDRQFAEIRSKVLKGDLPSDPKALAERLVEEKVLTGYQSERFLANKPYGLHVGRYVIQDRIGSGSMGRVYLARHRDLHRKCALKILPPSLVSRDPAYISRFMNEGRAAAALSSQYRHNSCDWRRTSVSLY